MDINNQHAIMWNNNTPATQVDDWAEPTHPDMNPFTIFPERTQVPQPDSKKTVQLRKPLKLV